MLWDFTVFLWCFFDWAFLLALFALWIAIRQAKKSRETSLFSMRPKLEFVVNAGGGQNSILIRNAGLNYAEITDFIITYKGEVVDTFWSLINQYEGMGRGIEKAKEPLNGQRLADNDSITFIKSWYLRAPNWTDEQTDHFEQNQFGDILKNITIRVKYRSLLEEQQPDAFYPTNEIIRKLPPWVRPED